MATSDLMGRVYLKVDGTLFERLESHRLPGETDDELFERALGPPESWARPLPAPAPPVLVRDPQRIGPARHAMAHAPAHCKCCDGRCRFAWTWRGVERCTCTPEKIAAAPPR